MRGLFGASLGLMLLVGVVGGAGLWVTYQRFSADLPDVDGLRNYQPPVMSRVYAGDSRLLAELATERRIFVPISAIPQIVRQAFISAEDQNFYTHRGVDPLAIIRAAMFDLTHFGQGRRPIGASTITQQVAKNMLLDNQISLARKIKEAILAMRIEQTLSKDRILELYLNEIYLGSRFVRRRGGGAGLFQQVAGQADDRRGGLPGGAAEGAEQLQPVQVSRGRAAAARLRAGPHGRGPCDHSGPGSRREGGADRAVGVPPSAADPRRRLVRRGSAPAAHRAIRPGHHDPGRPGGAHQPRSRAAGSQPSKSLRDGLMAYDRKMGGWRGAGHAAQRGSGRFRDHLARRAE